MAKFIKDSETGTELPVEVYKFEFHTDEAGVIQRVEDTPTLSFIEVGGEAPAESPRDEEPAKKEEPKKAAPMKEEKPSGFLRNNKDTQKGVN